MKIFFALCSLLTFSAFAQDPKAYIGAFDSKIYSLKSKGVKDFVVNVESSRLTKQMNEQQIFGKVDKLVFKVYWTATPERLAIEVQGLPEGFKEIKEELKASLLSGLDTLLPIGVHEKFSGYKIVAGTAPKEFIAQDISGIAPIPSYVLKFDSRDVLTEVIGRKPVGSFRVKSDYVKEGFSDGKWVLKEQVTTSEESGHTVISTKELDYGDANGFGVLEEVELSVTQRWEDPKQKPVTVKETLEFSGYQINTGEALKYFLGDGKK